MIIAPHSPTEPVRVLIHPQRDRKFLAAVTALLDRAIIDYPDTFDRVEDRPNIVDHYGYRDDMRSSVVLSAEDRSGYLRLTIRPELHPVFDLLAQAVMQRIQPTT